MTSAINMNTLHSYFSEYGWEISLAAPRVWQTGFYGTHGFFPLKASVNDTYISLEVSPVLEYLKLEGQKKALKERQLLRAILALNNDLQVVKLGLTMKGELSLSCQLINMDLHYHKFKTALEILGYYCDEVREYFAVLEKKDIDQLKTQA